MTLFKGDETNEKKAEQIEQFIRKQNHEEKFNEVITGEQKQVLKYYDQIKSSFMKDYYICMIVLNNTQRKATDRNKKVKK